MYCVDGSSAHGEFPLTWVPSRSNLTPSRCIIDRNHKWCIYSLFAYFDICWALNVIALSILLSENRYVLSYGQVQTSLCVVYHRMFIEYSPVQLLSAFLAVPTLVSTAKLVHFHRSNLSHFVDRFPWLCLAEARYLLTGKDPGSTVQDRHLPFNITSHPEEPVLGKPRDQIVMNVRSAHQSPRLPELDYAMRGRRELDTRFCAGCATSVNAICDKV